MEASSEGSSLPVEGISCESGGPARLTRRAMLQTTGAGLAGVALAQAFAACGPGQAGPSPSPQTDVLKELTTLRLGLIGKISGYWNMWIALQEGYFKAENINVTMTYIDTDARLTDALLAGSVDMDPETVFVDYSANQHGADITMFCGNQNLPFYRMLARKNLNSLSDLAGKKIGVSDKDSGVDAFVAQEWLGNKGIQLKDYTLINSGGLANRVAALSTGAIDATLLVPPFDLRAKGQGLNDLGVSTDTVRHFMFTAWSARKSWLKNNKTLAVAFCRAIIKGAKFLQNASNKDQAIKDLMDATGIDQPIASATYDVLPRTLSPEGSIDPEGFAPWAKFLNAKPEDIKKLLDDSYFNQAKATLK